MSESYLSDEEIKKLNIAATSPDRITRDSARGVLLIFGQGGICKECGNEIPVGTPHQCWRSDVMDAKPDTDNNLYLTTCMHCHATYSKRFPHACSDAINPTHYKNKGISHSNCGLAIECIDVSRHFNFNIGNVIKYLWRCGLKGDRLEQLKKAHWYLTDEIKRIDPDFKGGN
jgi:hypothetical protein